VFAFEPLPRNLTYLRRHIALNRIRSINVVEAAVSNRSGIAPFNRDLGPYEGSLEQCGDLEVRVVCLDELNLPSPDFMKIDIEGGEFNALVGAQSKILASKPLIFLATHGAEVHRQCCDLLRSWKYSLVIEESDVVATPS
jgi:FkbM family methyltransferase